MVPQDPSKPVTLQLKLDYAVCEKLCVPAEAKAELARSARRTASQDAALAAAEAGAEKACAGRRAALAVRSVRRERRAQVAHRRRRGGAADTVDLFAEGPTPQWALPVPAPMRGAPDGLQRFAFDLDGAPPGAKYGARSSRSRRSRSEGAIEVTTHLD